MSITVLIILLALVVAQVPQKLGGRRAIFLGITFVHLLTVMEDPLLSTVGTLLRFPIWIVGVLYALTLPPNYTKTHPPATSYRVYLTLVVLLTVWGALSLFWSVDRFDTVVKVTNFALIAIFMHLNLTRYWNGKRTAALLDVKVMTTGILITILLSTAFTFPDLLADFSGTTRYQGLFHNPNTLAALAAVSFFPTVLFYFRERSGLLRLAPLMLVAALFLSGSRSSTLAIIIAGTLTLLIYTLRNVRFLKYVAPALFFCGLFASISYLAWQLTRSPATQESVSTLPRQFNFEVSKSLFNGRESLWQIGLEVFQDRPFVGFGFNGTRTVLESMFQRGLYAGEPRQLHNSYLEVLVDLGLVGAFIFGSIVVVLLIRYVRAIAHIPLLCAAFLVPLILALSESALFGLSSIVATMFWTLSTILLTTEKEYDSGIELNSPIHRTVLTKSNGG